MYHFDAKWCVWGTNFGVFVHFNRTVCCVGMEYVLQNFCVSCKKQHACLQVYVWQRLWFACCCMNTWFDGVQQVQLGLCDFFS